MSSDRIISRRGFLGASAAAALGAGASVALAGDAAGTGVTITTADNKGVVTQRNDAAVEYEGIYDIVVVGAGGAGLCAATAAVDAGASVLVVDSQGSYLPSNTSICAGVVMACCTKQQAERGVEDSPENFRAYLEATSGGYMSDVVIDQWVKDGSGTIDFLADHGVEFPAEELVFSGAENMEPMCSVATPAMRGHYVAAKSGAVITSCLYDYDVEHGVDFVFNCRATDLISDPDGRIVGVATEKGNFRGNKGVIICSGGFIRNEYLSNTFLTSPYGSASSLAGETGEGLEMCLSVGAKVKNMWIVQSNSFGTEFSEGFMPSCRLYNTTQPCIAVGTDGQRVCAEDMFYEYRAKVVNSTDDGFVWIVWDQNTTDVGPQDLFVPHGSENCDDEVANGVVFRADTVADLAEQIGIDPAALEATVAHWNEMVASGEDADFGRTKNLVAIDRSPFYACKATPKGDDTAGGPVVTAKAEVVDWDDRPIPGLYAAGAVTGGWRGKIYPGSGTSVATGCLFGRLAGAAAVEEAGSAYKGTLSATAGSFKE